jgi:hypothetical protein
MIEARRANFGDKANEQSRKSQVSVQGDRLVPKKGKKIPLADLGISILQAMEDEVLFGRFFRGDSWNTWKNFLAGAFGLSIPDFENFQKHTRRGKAPQKPREAWLICGRRSGKSRIVALIAVYLAGFLDYDGLFAPGETGTLMVIGADRKGARVLFRYIRAMIRAVPVLEKMVISETKESIELANDCQIEVHTGNFRAVRGYTLIGALCDEIAFWRDDTSANPDSEVIAAIRPGMATVPSAMLIGLSSPHGQRGVMFDVYDRHFGKDDSPILVWQAPSSDMNPSLPKEVIREAYEDDPNKASAEYGGQFRRDVENYVAPEVVKAATIVERHELAPKSNLAYEAFVDASGGTQDSFTCAVAHQDDHGRYVLDALREIEAPFKPHQAVEDLKPLLVSYRITRVTGDRFAGEWPRERFEEIGIEYAIADKTKSEIYKDVLPELNSGLVELLDIRRLRGQISSLERRVIAGGRETIDHPPRAHDDVANAGLGAVWLLKNLPSHGCTW